MTNVPELLVIVTGLSGSGKSYVQSTLEDLGFYCADNIPMELIEPLLEEVAGRERHSRIGLVIDVRTHDFAERFPDFYREQIVRKVPHATLIFLEAADEVLVRRFSETRRPHPYGLDRPILEAIRAERRALLDVKSIANMVLDTSQFSVHELKAQIVKRFGITGPAVPMLITIITFGFKYPLPYNLDLLFDVRFMPNPHFVEELRPLSGLDPEIVGYLEAQPEFDEFRRRLLEFISYLLPKYQSEMKSYLTIGIGCTGGRHRSVAIGQWLHDQLRAAGRAVDIVHRDCSR
jgi:RNase adapter protein RapZ